MKKTLWIFAAVWLVVVAAGSAWLWRHSLTPGAAAGVAPESWPQVEEVKRVEGKPTLVMFAHPKCPCTRASIGELAVLMGRCQGKVEARVVFYQPKEMPEDWVHSDTWRSAEAIPGVTVQTDEDGRTAEKFHAGTSGQVVLYGADGRLLFSGGITEARGHSGDNDGRSALVEILEDGQAKHAQRTPVFGCSLTECELGEAPKS